MTFDVPLDTRSGVPYYRQIIDRVMLGLADGTLATGDRLPTVRGLAVRLMVNPNTVARAYHDLELLGVVETRPGSGTYVASGRPRAPEQERQRQLDRLSRDTAAKAEGLGLSLDELIETLQELRRAGAEARSEGAATREGTPQRRRGA